MKILSLISALLLCQASLAQNNDQIHQNFPDPENFMTEAPADGSKLTYDISLSSGSVNNVNYSEVNVGLNYFLTEWLNWRNAGFSRFVSEGTDVYGIDSSVRIYSVTQVGEEGGLTLFGGPGARVASEGDPTVFAEAGVVLNAAGLTFGFGGKTLFNKFNDSNAENDTQYFIILAGAGSL